MLVEEHPCSPQCSSHATPTLTSVSIMPADQSSCRGKMSVQFPCWGKNALYKRWISCIQCPCVCFCTSGAASHHLSPVCIFNFPVMYFLHQSFAPAVMDEVLKVSDGVPCKCVWLLLSWVWVREKGLSRTNTMFHLSVASIITAGPPAASSTSSFLLESHYLLQSDKKKQYRENNCLTILMESCTVPWKVLRMRLIFDTTIQ